MAALLATEASNITINDMKVHPDSGQLFLSVHRGRGQNSAPVILKVNDGRLEMLELNKLPHSKVSIRDLPNRETLEFGQLQS